MRDDHRVAGHPIFAAVYDRMMERAERAGLAERRAAVVSRARGRTLEIGAGTGHNLEHYTDAVTELILTEPDPHMAKRLRDRLAADPPAPVSVEVVEAGAESLPLDDGSFDSIVSTLVLCTVPDQAAVLEELSRVLKPGGSLLLVEHVHAGEGTALGRWQDRLERPWGWVSGGCHPNRRTQDALVASGFKTDLEDGRFEKVPPLARPLVQGSATRDG